VPCTKDAPADLRAETGPSGFTRASGQLRWETPAGVPSAQSVLSRLSGGGR
jgi:hypothetical protein